MTPRISFRDYLPGVFRAAFGSDAGDDFTGRFLGPLETLFEELQSEIEGSRDPDTGQLSGGLSDLFSPSLVLPPELVAPPAELEWLAYLASWIGLPLRPERTVQWNKDFIARAIQLSPVRGTLPGVSTLLRAWLKGDIVEIEPMVTDLTRARNDVDTVFQLGTVDPPEVLSNLTLGVNAVVGEGPPFLFVVDLVLTAMPSPTTSTQADDTAQMVLQAARSLLESEKPAYSHYQLRVRYQLHPRPTLVGETVAGMVWIFDSAARALRREVWRT